MRRSLSLLAVAAVAAAAPAAAQSPSVDPDRIPLPDGWQPEGIATGPGKSLYVGSISRGAVLKLGPRNATSRIVVPAREGRAAIGLKRAGKALFVAGGETGNAYVYNRRTGREIAAETFGEEGETFVNDVALAGRRAYFTDSRQPVIYSLNRRGRNPRELEVDVPITGDFNLNGIVAAGRFLLAVHSGDGDLYRIDRRTGDTQLVDLGDAELTNGDGMLLKGRRLFVVQNRDNVISTFRLGRKFASGRKTGELTNDEFDVPTTIAAQGKRLYAVNARFGNERPETAEYWVTQVR